MSKLLDAYASNLSEGRCRLPGMGNYRIVIDGIGPHHGCTPNTADSIARTAIAELQRAGATISAATLSALEADGTPCDPVGSLPVVDLLEPVPLIGQAVTYWFTNAGGTRCSRTAIVTYVHSRVCVNVDVAFDFGDTELGHGDAGAPGQASRTSVLGSLDGHDKGADYPPSWTRI